MTPAYACLTPRGTVLAALTVLACGPAPATTPRVAKTQELTPEYSVAQVDASRPDRSGKPQPTYPALPPPEHGVKSPTDRPQASAGCDAESCEGELTATAKQQIIEAMAAVTECYETELKGNEALEGRFSVLVRLPAETATSNMPCRPTVENGSLKWTPTFGDCLTRAFGKVSAKGKGGCVDVAVPLNLVRKEVQAPAPSTDAAPQEVPSGASRGSGAGSSAPKEKKVPSGTQRP